MEYRVISPHGIAWIPRYTSEDAGWQRIAAVTRVGPAMMRKPWPLVKADLVNAGWKVKPIETTK